MQHERALANRILIKKISRFLKSIRLADELGADLLREEYKKTEAGITSDLGLSLASWRY